MKPTEFYVTRSPAVAEEVEHYGHRSRDVNHGLKNEMRYRQTTDEVH